jgi:hypothetical protein
VKKNTKVKANKATRASTGLVATCGHLVWADGRCAQMLCENYVNKASSGKGKGS